MNKCREVSDLVLAAYLSVSGHKLVSTPQSNSSHGNRTIFVFEDSPKIEIDILGFYNRHARVEPLGFAEMQRHLKGLTR
jgi:hypothetical protein